MPYKNKEDQAKAARKHYEANRDAMIRRAAEHTSKLREDIKLYIQDLKNKTPCLDCDRQYPFYVMQFDHIKGEKLFNLAMMNQRWSWKRVLAEIEKCEIVCANCHAERTYQRAQVDAG